MRIAIDLDGVVWRGADLIPGSSAAVDQLLAAGHSVAFCTNDARAPWTKRAALDALGVPAAPVVTSAQAAIACCEISDRLLILGSRDLTELALSGGHNVTDLRDIGPAETPSEADVVLVGSHEDWDRSRIGMAADAIRNGARFIATNDDATFPTVGLSGPRLLPGNGALVAAVAAASDRLPEIAGKPHTPMIDLLVATLGGTVDLVIGDRVNTDGLLAERLGARFALVTTGVASAADIAMTQQSASLVGSDLAAIAELVAGSADAHQ